MLTLQKTGNKTIDCVSTADKSIEQLLNKEWLLTNSRGGYSSSTVVGCNTRRYHGLLTGSLTPPVNRIVGLSNCQEMVITNGRATELATFEFDGKFAPVGFGYIKKFRHNAGAHFDYQLDQVNLTKSVYLLRDSDTVALVYNFTKVNEPVEFVVRPFVALRDFHSLQKSYAGFCSKPDTNGVLVRHDVPESCELFLYSPAAKFESDKRWWFNFLYRVDRRRGQDCTEDLWSPGFFKCRMDSPGQIVLWANLDFRCKQQEIKKLDIDSVRKELDEHLNTVSDVKDKQKKTLYIAADRFVANRQTEHGSRTTILAGFPWFADWGRDAFVSLPGLLLLTGRFDEAKSVLTTFAGAADDGMVPNYFDDRTNTANFNSIDASLWFINAAFQYLRLSEDTETFSAELLPVIRWIVDAYRKGNIFGLGCGSDGLVSGGTPQTQLTWMDAKYQDRPFTPRYGRAVEINALWYNALCLLGRFDSERGDVEQANRYHSLAEKVKENFSKFWNTAAGYLNDCIFPDDTVDESIRPNQIFAVSLAFSPISAERQRSVVQVVERELLTPYGLRTLSASDSNYKGRYEGPQAQRDEAYHQGTVWPYLMGAFVEAYLKVNGFSKESKKQAAGFIEPLMSHLTEDGCIGSISEIFDGDQPQQPKGCIAQAWSVAELIRAYHLIHD